MYSLKFFILLTGIVFLGLTDVGWQFFKLYEAKKQIQRLTISIQKKEKLFLNKQNMQNKNPMMDKEKITNIFLMTVESSGLSLHSFYAIEKNRDHAIDIDSVMIGNFQQFFKFFKTISRQCFPFLIHYAEIRKDHYRWKLRLNLVISGICLRSANESLAQNFSIKQLKFAGFLQYHHHLAAIILLPTGESKEIMLGDFLGVEHARVIHIDENGIKTRIG